MEVCERRSLRPMKETLHARHVLSVAFVNGNFLPKNSNQLGCRLARVAHLIEVSSECGPAEARVQRPILSNVDVWDVGEYLETLHFK